MSAFPVAIGLVLLLFLTAAALVLGVISVARVGGHPFVKPDADAPVLAWLAQERTRLLAAALLGAVVGVGLLALGFRFGATTGLFLAGALGAVATLLAVWLMPEPALPPGRATASGGGRGWSPMVGLAAVAGLVSRRLARRPVPLTGESAAILATIRRRVVAGVVAGGLLTQLAILTVGCGLPLVWLSDLTPAANDHTAMASVPLEPHATIGIVLVLLGVPAAGLAVLVWAVAGVALVRLGEGRAMSSVQAGRLG